MNDSHLLQYPISSLMSSAVRREQLTQNLPTTGVAERVPIQGRGRLGPSVREREGPLRGHDVTGGETETQRNEELAQERQDQGSRSI